MRNLPINLFCVPYAGASATVYLPWKKFLEPYDIHVIPLELCGHGKRYNEGRYNTMAEAIKDVCDMIISQQGDSSVPYALYGHSMGCTIVYEVFHLLRNEGYTTPIHVFLSGRYPPHITKPGKKIHLLEGKELVQEIRSLGGTDESILSDPVLQNIFFPTIKEDYRILETYRYIPYSQKISCPVTVVNGTNDERVNYEEAIGWKYY